jgi:hypothetical protein
MEVAAAKIARSFGILMNSECATAVATVAARAHPIVTDFLLDLARNVLVAGQLECAAAVIASAEAARSRNDIQQTRLQVYRLALVALEMDPATVVSESRQIRRDLLTAPDIAVLGMVLSIRGREQMGPSQPAARHEMLEVEPAGGRTVEAKVASLSRRAKAAFEAADDTIGQVHP